MKIHFLEREQFLPVSPGEAWRFFSDPRNLEGITPPDLGFRIVSLEEGAMYAGQRIVYRIRVAPLLWVRWVTEIEEVEPERSFVDVQMAGPYRLWRHRHGFEAVDGGVRMRDEVRYALGFGPFGALAHALFVRRKLEWIFDFRARILAERFGQEALIG